VILCDPRFGSERKGQRSSHRAVSEALVALGVEVEPMLLPFGDFAFIGNGPDGPIQIGVELKVVSDLVTSMRSGRLAEQIIGMSAQYARSYVVIEGLYRVNRRNGLLEVPRGRMYSPLRCGPRPIYWSDIERFITGIEEAGVRVRRTRSSFETALVIHRVIQGFWDKDYKDHTSLQVMRSAVPPMTLVREDPVTARIRRVAKALDVGIGWERSKAVAEHFRSIARLAEADAGEWEGIEGIGATIARDARKAIREEITASRVPARVVPQRDRAAARSPRDSRQRPSRRVDTARAAQRRVPANRAGRRDARGSRTE
jgi:ERCC4-type nuclease